MLKEIVKSIVKQKVFPGVGEFTETLSLMVFFGSILNWVMVAGTFYYTTVRFVFPWFDLPKFIIGLCVGMMVIFVVVYKYVAPALWVFRGRQMDLRKR